MTARTLAVLEAGHDVGEIELQVVLELLDTFHAVIQAGDPVRVRRLSLREHPLTDRDHVINSSAVDHLVTAGVDEVLGFQFVLAPGKCSVREPLVIIESEQRAC
ncbi:hypothetical protein D9M68_749990 [compost metagenome]